MNKKLALGIGGIILFVLLNIFTGGSAWTIVVLALIVFVVLKMN